METKNMIYIVSEYASQGEIFGMFSLYYVYKHRESRIVILLLIFLLILQSKVLHEKFSPLCICGRNS